MIAFGKYNPFAVDDEDTIVMEYDTGMTASFILTTGEVCCEEKIMYEKSADTQLLEKFAQAALKHDEGCLVAKGAEGLHSLMLCAGAYYSACKGIRVDLPLDAVRYKELMDNLIEDEKNAPVM